MLFRVANPDRAPATFASIFGHDAEPAPALDDGEFAGRTLESQIDRSQALRKRHLRHPALNHSTEAGTINRATVDTLDSDQPRQTCPKIGFSKKGGLRCCTSDYILGLPDPSTCSGIAKTQHPPSRLPMTVCSGIWGMRSTATAVGFPRQSRRNLSGGKSSLIFRNLGKVQPQHPWHSRRRL